MPLSCTFSGPGKTLGSGFPFVAHNPLPAAVQLMLISILLPLLFGACDLFSSALDDRAPRIEIQHPTLDTTVSGEFVMLVIGA